MPNAYTTPDYQFILRSVRTLAAIDEIAPQDVRSVSWTRTIYGGGMWSMTLPRNYRYTPTALAIGQLLVIMRDGVVEFAGVLQSRTIDPLAKTWTIGGYDLTGYWLSQRIVGPTTPEAHSGVGETVLVAYVDAALGSTADAARKAETYIDVTFTAAANDSPHGSTVTYSANRQPLLTVTSAICAAAALQQEVVIDPDYSGYSYQVRDLVDHTIGGVNAIPFSVDWDNVEGLQYSEDYRQYRNHHYIAGDGTAGSRAITEAEDAGSVATYGRWESVVDVPTAVSTGSRTSVGDAEIAKRTRQLVTVKCKPFRHSANAVYRTDFDLGWNVTFAEPGLRDESVDMPIVAVTVAINEREEDITMELGERLADSTMTKIIASIERLQHASAV